MKSITVPENSAPMSKILVFLFSGKAGVGKTFSALYTDKILADSGYRCMYIPLAKEVKRIAKLMGWNGDKDSLGRALLQAIGNAGRNYNKDLWVNKVINTVHNSEYYPDVLLIDDWRYENEYDRISEEILFKPVTIRIESDGRRSIEQNSELSLDVSETSLDSFSKFDYILNNDIKDADAILDSIDKIVETEILKNRRK